MKLALITVFLFLGNYSFASSIPCFVVADTVIDHAPYALTQDEFIAQYGRDDSSKALINFFFQKRSRAQNTVGGGAVVTVLAAVGLGVSVHAANTKTNDIGNELASIFAVAIASIALGAGIAVVTVGAALWGRYSKKRLLILLKDYFAGKPMARGIAKNRMFRGFVQYGEWNRDIDRELKTTERNRKMEQRRR